MKTSCLSKMALYLGMVFLSIGSVFGQKINFSIKEAVESLKRDNQCSYCVKIYQFSTQAQKIMNIAKDLKNLSGKKKEKKFRRFQKVLDEFIANCNIQYQGLAKELSYSKGENQEADTVKSIIKLQGYLGTISQLFTQSPDLIKVEGYADRISKLQEEITKSLKP